MGRAFLLSTFLLLLAACGREDGPPRKPAAAPLSVRVMSFNLRWDGFDDGDNAWPHRRDLVYRVLRAFDPHSVGTQEPMIRQIEDIRKALPALRSYRFDNDPDYPRTQQILYRNDLLERIDYGGFLLADGTNKHGTVRYCSWVRLRERASRRSYDHFNVHLDQRSRVSRTQSVVRLMQHIAGRKIDVPFVITGDFNAPEDGPAMAFLFGRQTLPNDAGEAYTNPIPLVDTYRLLHGNAPDSGTAGGFRGKREGRKIDHVLVAAGAARVLEATIVHTQEDGRYPSDHFPVTAVVAWP